MAGQGAFVSIKFHEFIVDQAGRLYAPPVSRGEI